MSEELENTGDVTESAESQTEAPEPVAPVVQETPAPASALGEETTRQAVVHADDLDQRFANARNLVQNDEMLSESEKQIKLIELDVMHEARTERRQQGVTSEEDRIRNGYAKQFGAQREVVDAEWSKAAAESVRRRGRFDHGTAMTIFEDRMAAAKQTTASPTPIAEKKPVGQTRTEPRGIRQTAAPAEKRITVQEMMDRAVMGDTSAIPRDVFEEAKR